MNSQIDTSTKVDRNPISGTPLRLNLLRGKPKLRRPRVGRELRNKVARSDGLHNQGL